jgi:hypothetical protein
MIAGFFLLSPLDAKRPRGSWRGFLLSLPFVREAKKGELEGVSLAVWRYRRNPLYLPLPEDGKGEDGVLLLPEDGKGEDVSLPFPGRREGGWCFAPPEDGEGMPGLSRLRNIALAKPAFYATLFVASSH